MRTAFLQGLDDLASKDDRIMFITADLGFGVFEEFEEKYPSQYLNAGVAEQNMTAIAAGMALEGRKVFTYSIGNFPTLRCLEQIRNDLCYHDLNVKIIGMGGGFSYGQLGMSHHATEDISIMRSLPNMTVIAPGTAEDVSGAMKAFSEIENPAYLRLDKSKADDQPQAEPFILGKARYICEGDALTIVASGGILGDVLVAKNELSKQGIHCCVLSMHTIKPIDGDALLDASINTGGILTVEENNILGGLGGAVAEFCLENNIRPKVFKRMGLQDAYPSVVGDQNYLKTYYQIDSESIENTVIELLRSS